jgi:hypothetical protein
VLLSSPKNIGNVGYFGIAMAGLTGNLPLAASYVFRKRGDVRKQEKSFQETGEKFLGSRRNGT